MELESVYGKEIIQRGEGYIDNVNQCIKIGNFIYADVSGTHEYKTKVNLETLEGDCSCPYGSNCKHAVAAYLYHKQGKSDNADNFIEHLQELDKVELIRLIVDNLPKNTEMATDFTIKNTTNISDFVEDFITDFSYSKMRKAEKLIDFFSFRQLMRLIKFLGKHEFDGFGKLYEKMYEDRGYSSDDDSLYDFKGEVVGAMVKKISSESELIETIKTGNASHEIIGSAEQFAKFKGTIKKHFSKNDYLSFLLMLKNPDLEEISKYINDENRELLWSLPDDNINLALRLGKHLKDKTLLFLAALEKKDCSSLLKYFDYAERLLEDDDYTIDTGRIIDILAKNNVKDEKIAKKLLKKEFFRNYSESQLKYLVGQINDFESIERELSKDFPESKPLLERLVELNTKRAKTVICRPNSLGNQSLEDSANMALFVKSVFGRKTLIDFIESNKERLATASALKNRLKEEGIFVSAQKGCFTVEVGK